MEQQPTEIPTFITPEKRDDIEFYQGWIRTAFIEGLAGVDALIGLRERFTLSRDDLTDIKYRGIDLDILRAAAAEINAKIEEEVRDAARDIRRNVFEADLFKVGIVVEDETWLVENVTTEGECIVPIIEGEPYHGGIDDVLFDR